MKRDTMFAKLALIFAVELIVLSLIASRHTTCNAAPPSTIATTTCQPRQLVFCQETKSIYVGDEASGDVLQIAPESQEITLRKHVADGLRDLVRRPNHEQLLVADNANQELILLNAAQLTVETRISTQVEPQYLAMAPHGDAVLVTDPWSRTAEWIQLDDGSSRQSQPVTLSFEPGQAMAIDEHSFLVADAFGGNLAVLNFSDQPLAREFQLRGHNIGGLALSADNTEILITHQILNRLARTDFDDIHWGNLIQNVVSKIPLEVFKSSDNDLNQSRQLLYLGDTGQGFADPGCLIENEAGLIVLSRGTDLAMWLDPQGTRHVVSVGRNPQGLVEIAENRFATVGRFSADLTLIEVDGTAESPSTKLAVRKKLLGSPSVSQSDLGEAAFHDGRLAHDGWMSCHSCHVSGHTAGVLVDTLGDGQFGNPKLIPSLFGAAETAPFGWLGNKKSLQDQLRTTLHGTMQSEGLQRTSEVAAMEQELETINQLVAYMNTLRPPRFHGPENAVAEKIDSPQTSGRMLFERFGCVRCHQGDAMTSESTYDVGLVDERGGKEFNPPSLRGVGFRRKLFHDGRAAGVSSVINDWKHQIPAAATKEELAILIEYVRHL